jgi:hypothetical protein
MKRNWQKLLRLEEMRGRQALRNQPSCALAESSSNDVAYFSPDCFVVSLLAMTYGGE